MSDEMATPQHDRLMEVRVESQAIGEFIDWLYYEHGVMLAHYGDGERLYTYHRNVNEMLAEFFGIDLQELEQEKRAMLARLRGESQGRKA